MLLFSLLYLPWRSLLFIRSFFLFEFLPLKQGMRKKDKRATYRDIKITINKRSKERKGDNNQSLLTKSRN